MALGLGRVAQAVAGGLLAVLLIWQLAIWLFAPPAFILPAPAAVAAQLVLRAEFLARNAVLTFSEACLGLLAGTLAGALVAIGIAALPRIGSVVWPLVLVLQALPVFAIAPLLVIWFGFGMASKVVMTSLIVFFPVASAFADGIRRTDRAVLDACALTPASPLQVLRLIRVPLALPYFVSGVKVAAPLAPLGAVVGEWVGSAGGLGFVMLQANARMQTAEVFAALVFIAVLTLVLRALVDAVTAPLAPWARETAPERASRFIMPRKEIST
ncbi:ABC transporter permease [Oryzicola mucosus]|uniref:ABC transporter permease n=1 Tax=Oryzicola mucosus TaxID=2767425 RepID=A0A8J6PNB9_9HYPH|nr:ABC transporter permease [Oryzicola mucosus]MBD0414465.1 ABC transporter permease [Oryzicola mucosus]